MGMGVRRIRSEANRLAKDDNGVLQLAALQQAKPQPVLRLEVVRLETYRFPKLFDRLVELAHLHQGDAEVHMGMRVVRTDENRLSMREYGRCQHLLSSQRFGEI